MALQEGLRLCRVLEIVIAGGDVKDIALLTPYNGQLRELKRRFSNHPQLATLKGAVQISSIDGFQVGCHATKSDLCKLPDRS